MADLGDRIGGALFEPGPVPSGGALVGYAGGRRALTEALSGMDGPPRPGDFGGRDTDDFRAANNRWRSASRRAQRADEAGAPGKQRRRTPAERLTPAQRGRLEERAAAAKVEEISSRGMRARMKVRMSVDTPNARGRGAVRTRVMPSGGPGVLIDAATTREILEDARERGDEVAADLFRPAFFIAYGGGLEDLPLEIEDVIWLKVWPNGEPEPPDPS